MYQYVWAMYTNLQESGRNPSIESLRFVDPIHSSVEEVLIDHLTDSILKEWQNRKHSVSCSCVTTEDVGDQLTKLDYFGFVVLPTGSLAVGLCRHRALLFKVMDDIIDLSCQITRSCKYHHKDDATSCFVWLEPDMGYLVDLIENPGSVVNEEDVRASVLQKQLDMNMMLPDRNNQESCSIMKAEHSQLPMPSTANQPTRRDKNLQSLKCRHPYQNDA
ncbi:hypothetical protein Nepgr_009817 [Nepenthes gracilis]|uniref:EDR1/CTR1/ARMC3-like peptidase-like domain-containing protein n=1 Tax=Nepenthes gracilis TaxID=150966 RepID=A0AAD3XKH6_NEPGR|nr:hypothetical protein Nepgr_009817 [Nepenthes gracilis]